MTSTGFKSRSDNQAMKAYAEFEEKIKRTVYLYELSPAVTESVITSALNQFGEVVSVEILPNLSIPYDIPSCALVEMKDPKQAAGIITELNTNAFMMSGMPRPVGAQAAEAEMFANRPPVPGREVQVRWVPSNDPDFTIMEKTKLLCKKHTAETLALAKLTLGEEKKLAEQQKKTLEANHTKLDMIEKIRNDAARLGRRYGMNLEDID